mgnify:FL=1
MADVQKKKLDRSVVAPGREIIKLERRLFLQRGLSLGALTMLSGCDVTDAESVQKVLWTMSRWNDGVQAAIFDPNKLAPTYPESAITPLIPLRALGAPQTTWISPVSVSTLHRRSLSALGCFSAWVT